MAAHDQNNHTILDREEKQLHFPEENPFGTTLCSPEQWVKATQRIPNSTHLHYDGNAVYP